MQVFRPFKAKKRKLNKPGQTYQVALPESDYRQEHSRFLCIDGFKIAREEATDF